MGWNSNIFPLLIFTSSGGFTGEFGYSPGPGAGNLIYSNTFATKDPYGNITLTGGPATYSNASGGALALGFDSVQVYTGSLSAGWTLVSSIFNNGNPIWQSTSTDGNTYDIGGLHLFTTINQPITSTSNTVITGLSKPVGIGKYHFEGIIRSQQGATNVNQLIGFSGPATSQAIWFYKQSNSSAGAVMSVTTGVSGLSTVGIGYGAVSATNYFEFTGTATFTAAGTFSVVAAEGTAGDSFTVQQGSKFNLSPIVAS